MQLRVRNYRSSFPFVNLEPVAGNYFPLTEIASINGSLPGIDPSVHIELVTDHARAAGSLLDGSLEVSLHRRLIEGYGLVAGNVKETLNDTAIVRSRQQVRFRSSQSPYTTAYWPQGVRSGAILLNHPLVPFFFESVPPAAIRAFSATHRTRYSALSADLPSNIHLLSLIPQQGTDQLLLRLYNHVPVAEGGVTQAVDLSLLLAPLQLSIDTEATVDGLPLVNATALPSDNVISIAPMAIRAFFLSHL